MNEVRLATRGAHVEQRLVSIDDPLTRGPATSILQPALLLALALDIERFATPFCGV